MDARDDTEPSRRDYKAPYTTHHPVPTIGRYREEKAQREAQYASPTSAQDDSGWTERAADTAKAYWKGEKHQASPSDSSTSAQPYPSHNKNLVGREDDQSLPEHQGQDEEPMDSAHDPAARKDGEGGGDVAEDTSEDTMATKDARERRKLMKKKGDDPTKRTVTDPVTHLPITIHDFTKNDLKTAPQNEPAAGTHRRTATGTSAKDKSEDDLRDEATDSQAYHSGMEMLFPPPEFDNIRVELARIYKTAATVGLSLVVGLTSLLLALARFFIRSDFRLQVASPVILLATAGTGAAIIWAMRDWIDKKVANLWDDETWEAERQRGKELAKAEMPESTQWLNSLLASIWPLVNPDLFTSLVDTLEDVMQASLPKVVRMVSVDDLGQGSESVRILGVRWLPTGAAGMSVSQSGKLKGNGDSKHSDRTVPNEGETESIQDDEGKKEKSPDKLQENENIGEGLEAEEGDFVNVEIAFSYRARTVRRGIRDRAKNMHLYLAFYLPGNIRLPVWVELHGLVGTMRLRLQLCPDPPFFSLCTMTFLGQPKVSVSCIPLTQRGLNIMDLPLISNFVQSSIDAAMAEYVAPKSLTLDLKDMLMGDDFKKDTAARGVIMVRIVRAFDFKEGDAGFLWKKGSTDGYVSSEMEPVWDETAFVLVTADELNVEERLRVQLWDSDRTTADDDLGRIELDIKQLMRSPESRGKMMDRVDGFKALTAGETMPGKLKWSVGYFPKVRVLDSQLAQQQADPEIRSVDQLKQIADEESEQKLRESKKDESAELEQQKAQDFKPHSNGTWRSRRFKPLKLAVRKRYASPVIVEFKKPKSVLDGLQAYGVFWLKDVPDNEEQTITVSIWKGGDMKHALTCSADEVRGATKVGTVTLRVTLWSGLSGYHIPLASKDPNIAQVMEVLDTAHDNDEMDFDVGDGGSSSSSSSSSSDDSGDESDYKRNEDGDVTPTTSASRGSGESVRSGGSDGLSKNGKRGLAASVKEYKRHRKQLHRSNRGMMQWKGPRTLQWMKHKVEHGEQRVENLFKHREREAGIETEV
ncbi:putative meiotically up-regulated protein [Diplodia seriata]|uniref:Putative meiotically up-regulated protein n=1 Tax=Diplodia seriata TaxID=420778 RepID=A0A0G2G8L8_9PEZI|nr:putative meiotically up-regulated protein [Diplodia seriata]